MTEFLLLVGFLILTVSNLVLYRLLIQLRDQVTDLLYHMSWEVSGDE